ncbi:ornithine cyclodeaminase [Marininema mesophilum]|uniref:Ornithine cyclodeaminase n=1 Tax=Marininema mesophilum TaxID=1048340 RepID=A0A1H3CCZ3_9BACL|nr:hypothetical protein [Marininema mesophilum]SDX51464.1 ornithine cyclodeaminase [Marininema mesophilum]
MLILKEKEIRTHFQMSEGIADVEKAIEYLAQGTLTDTPRTVFSVEEKEAGFLYMPAYVAPSHFAAVKIISVFPHRTKEKKSAIQGLTLLSDGETGEHLALMDATWLTVMRTGALSGVAAKHLAREDSRTLGVIGCGAQARGQIEAMLNVRPIEKLLLFNRRAEKAHQLASEIEVRHKGRLAIHVVEDPNQVASHVDILVTSTNSHKPVYDDSYIKPGTHVSAIGSYRPVMQEIDEETLKRSSRIVVDTLEGVLEEAGDFLIPIKKGSFSRNQIDGELTDIVAGRISGRKTPSEITFFKSVGFSLLDAVISYPVWKRAQAAGDGLQIDW